MAIRESLTKTGAPSNKDLRTERNYAIFELGKIRKGSVKLISKANMDTRIVKKFNNNKPGSYIPPEEIIWQQWFT